MGSTESAPNSSHTISCTVGCEEYNKYLRITRHILYFSKKVEISQIEDFTVTQRTRKLF